MPNTAERVNIIESRVLSHDWYLLKKITFDYLRNNGDWQRQTREVYDRGNGAAILLFNREKKNRRTDPPVQAAGVRQRP